MCNTGHRTENTNTNLFFAKEWQCRKTIKDLGKVMVNSLCKVSPPLVNSPPPPESIVLEEVISMADKLARDSEPFIYREGNKWEKMHLVFTIETHAVSCMAGMGKWGKLS
jgi:hypothetical protein